MSKQQYDTIVIGTGPGGEGAAMKLMKGGRKVAVIEKYHAVGGGCTHWGTIPSKALRHAIKRLIEFNQNQLFRNEVERHRQNFKEVLKTAESVIAKQVNLRSGFYARNEVKIYFGFAHFLDANTVEVNCLDGTREILTAESFVIASGSRPYRPPEIDFNHPRIFDSDTILNLDKTPHKIAIYGAGVIGCEYASIFSGLGLKVELINTRDRMLSYLDDEVSDALSYHMRDQGILIRHNETVEKVDANDERVKIYFHSGKVISTDILLWANGRTGNSQNMGLEALGITPNSRGQLDINENYQTPVDHIYAVGDVIGFPALASAAYDQGRFAATHIAEGQCDTRLVKDVPIGIYTLPEISSVGQTERDLTAEKVPYEVGVAYFKNLARAQISGQTVGMLKILFHRETYRILGIHCFGDQASEIVHIGQAIMAQEGEGNNIKYFTDTTFNYPTMAEAYRVAAINGLNRIS